MTPSDVAALVLSILAGLAAVISALASAMMAFRVGTNLREVRRDVNGRLDQLMGEQEQRVRAQERLRHAVQAPEIIPPPPAVGRGEPVIRQIRPDEPKGE